MTDPGQGAEDADLVTASPAPGTLIPWMAKEQHKALTAGRVAQRGGRRGTHRRRSPTSRRVEAALVTGAGLAGAATVGTATGADAVDRLLRGGLAATVAATAVTAPTWAIVVLATGAAALGYSGDVVASTAGLASLVLALVLVWRQDLDRNVLKAATGALAATALLRAPGGLLGMTAAATGVLATMTAVAGLRGRRRWRRRALFAVAGLVGLATVATILGGVAGLAAGNAFRRSSSSVAAALAGAQQGDNDQAAEGARVAAADLRRARGSVRAWWARPAWAVPVVGAHLRAADRVASTAGPAVQAAAESAGALQGDVLRPEAGRLDLARLGDAEPELTRLSAALHNASRGSADARSPWLAAPLQERLRTYDAQLADLTVASDRALLAVRTLPGLLGRDRPTRWFVAIANPAESRELGGFVGDYAVLVADNGVLRLERSGGVRDIGADVEGRNLDGVDLPARYLSQRPEVYWQNLTGYPDLPTVASAARVLWDQVAPGAPLDGVVYIDPHGLAALLRLTGPVTVPGPLGTLDAGNAAQLLLSDQYTRFEGQRERDDALQEVSSATFTALSRAELPGPGAIGAALGPAVRGGHLAATSFSAEGQLLLDDIGAGGRLPAAGGGDLASLRTSNLLENKLDFHVRRSVRYRAVVDPATGRVEATATIELRNDATADLPDYVAANRRGLPKGTDLLEVAWYSGLGLEVIEVDGRPVSATSDRERGWWTHSTKVEVPAGGSATVVLRLAGELGATRPYRLAVAPQAAAQVDAYTVEVEGTRGWIADDVRQPKPAQRDDVVVRIRRR